PRRLTVMVTFPDPGTICTKAASLARTREAAAATSPQPALSKLSAWRLDASAAPATVKGTSASLNEGEDSACAQGPAVKPGAIATTRMRLGALWVKAMPAPCSTRATPSGLNM